MGKKSTGMSTVTSRNFRAAGKKIGKAARALNLPLGSTMRMIGEEILTDVKTSVPGKGVPVDEGTLRSTGRVVGPSGKGGNVSITFGGPAAPYALVQHENMQYKHKLGEARYLVRGMERWNPSASAAYKYLKEQAQRVAEGKDPAPAPASHGDGAAGSAGGRRRDPKTGRFLPKGQTPTGGGRTRDSRGRFVKRGT